MKKRVTNYLIVFLLIGLTGYNAQTTYTWTGATNTSFTTSSNWSPSGPPTAGDHALFTSSGVGNCVFDDPLTTSLTNMTITSGYTGSVDASAGFVITNYIQDGGTFIAPSTDMYVSGNFSHSGGVFTHNSGNVNFLVGTVGTTISGSTTFNSITLGTNGAPVGERSINFGTSTANDLILGGGARPFNYAGSVQILASLTINGTATSAPTGVNTGTFTFGGSGAITVTGATNSTRNRLPNIEINTTGTISTTGNLNIMGNWTGTQGTWSPGSSTENFYGSSVSVTGANAAFDNLVVLSGSTLSLPSGQEVKVAGSITRTGGLTIPATAILGLNGSGAQSLSGSAYTLNGLRLYNTGGSRVVTLSTGVNITDFVEVQANVTLASGSGNLVLKATSSSAGRVTSLQSGGAVTGSVTVETYLPGPSTGWANLGVRGVMGQTVKSWDTYSTSSQANGIPMTCNGCSYDENALGSHFVSIQDYTEASGAYGELTGSSALNPGQGYWTYVGTGTSATSDLMVINTGSLVRGQQNINCTNAGTPVFDGFENLYYNLVANPYASPILWSNVFNNGSTTFLDFEDGIYAWNADLVGGTGDFAVFKNSVSSGGLTDVIPGGQGFYVGLKQFPSSSILEFHEIDKVTSAANDPVLKPASTNTISLFRLKLQGPSGEETETVMRIEPTATPFYDNKFDAHKMFMTPGYVGYQGPYTKYTTISTKDGFDVDYAINAIPPLTQSVSIPVLARVAYTGTFNISVFDIQNFNQDVCIGLIDKLDNSYHDLRNGAYSFAINDTTSASRFNLVLCKDNSISTVGITEEQALASNVIINQNQEGAYVRTAFPVNTKATISAYNLMGQKLMEDIKIEGTATTTRLNLNNHGQVVFITVNTSEGSTRKKMLLN